MHLRRCLLKEVTDTDLQHFFDGSWILNAYNEVTLGKREVKVVQSLRETRERCMPPFVAPDRTGIQQCLLYDARNLATVAATGVWMHFQRRILTHVRSSHSLSEEKYRALSSDERRVRKLILTQMAADMCKRPSDLPQAPAERREWVERERIRLGIDEAVGEWADKPLLCHLKTNPHRFLPCSPAREKQKRKADQTWGGRVGTPSPPEGRGRCGRHGDSRSKEQTKDEKGDKGRKRSSVSKFDSRKSNRVRTLNSSLYWIASTVKSSSIS